MSPPQKEWVECPDSKVFRSLSENIRKKLKAERIGLRLYKNPDLLVKTKSAHTARQITGEGVLSDLLMEDIRRQNINLIFLCETGKVQVIAKPLHNLFESEVEISKTAAAVKTGPLFYGNLDSPLGIIAIEEYLSAAKGWYPVYEIEKNILRHKELFSSAFGAALGRFHLKGYLWGELIPTHVFFNLSLHECRLIDFGNSRTAETSELDCELATALNFLKEKLFPPKAQEAFLLAYEKSRRRHASLRTDTVRKNGKETLYQL